MDFSVTPRVTFDARTSDFQAGQHSISEMVADIYTRTIPGFRRQLVDLTNDAAEIGAHHARLFSPGGANGSGRLKTAIEAKRAIYHPGGAGGGGGWESKIDVDTVLAPEAVYLYQGTGEYGPHAQRIFAKHHRQSASTIFKTTRFPDNFGNQVLNPFVRLYEPKARKVFNGFLAFRGYQAGFIFRHSVGGIKPQREWWDGAVAAAQAHLRVGLAEIDARSAR